MDINQLLRSGDIHPLPGKAVPEQASLRDLLASLRPGQLLQARVLSLPRPDIARLLINDVPLNASTSRPLVLGQTLQLTVIKGGDTPELRILGQDRSMTGQDVLRLALPRQLPLLESLNGMKALSQRLLPLLAGPAGDALRTLLDGTVSVRQLTPEQLREQVRNSGLFTEACMARGQLPDGGDRKVLLMRLASALAQRQANGPAAARTAPNPVAGTDQPAKEILTRASLLGAAADNARAVSGTASPGQAGAAQAEQQAALDRLWRLVDASLARIQTHQAASLPAEDSSRPAWQLEVPLLLAGGAPQTLELRIEQEASGMDENSSEPGWQATIGFNFAELGPVKAGVRLVNGRIHTTFWCEHPDTVGRFDRQLPRLRQTLEGTGLEVSHLAACRGEPPATPTARSVGSNLLDERA